MKNLWAMGLVLGLVMCIGAQRAEARGIAIVNTGEDVAHVADIKDEVRSEVEADTEPGVAVGIMYSRFGLFWLDIWRWDSRYVLYQGDNVWEEIPEEALKEIAAGGLSKPFTMTLPPGLIILILGGLGFGVMSFLGRGDEDELAPAVEMPTDSAE
jgi:hypothetical protein